MGDEISERTLGLLRKSNREWIRLRRAFLLRPADAGLWRTRRRDRQRIYANKISRKGDRECTRRGRQPNPPPPSDSTELAEVLRRDRPLMNQPSSGSRRTMAGRVEIYAGGGGGGKAAKNGPRKDADFRGGEKNHAKTQRGGKM